MFTYWVTVGVGVPEGCVVTAAVPVSVGRRELRESPPAW